MEIPEISPPVSSISSQDDAPSASDDDAEPITSQDDVPSASQGDAPLTSNHDSEPKTSQDNAVLTSQDDDESQTLKDDDPLQSHDDAEPITSLDDAPLTSQDDAEPVNKKHKLCNICNKTLSLMSRRVSDNFNVLKTTRCCKEACLVHISCAKKFSYVINKNYEYVNDVYELDDTMPLYCIQCSTSCFFLWQTT